jgi:hypothetical protein
VWEVIPWSWLADYVSNISDIIDAAVTNTANVTWVSKTVTETTVVLIQTTCDSAAMTARLLAYGITGGGGGNMGVIELRRTSMTRTKGVSLGIPEFRLEKPSGLAQYANTFAAVFALRSPSAFKLRTPTY